MKKTIISLGVAILLSACASPQTNMKNENLNNKTKVIESASEEKATATISPLKDKENILSRRIIYFDYDKDTVKPEFVALIQAHAEYLRQNPDRTIRLEGHADERGSREYNMSLGQHRDTSVAVMLNILGVRNDRIESISFGEDKPQIDRHDEDSWAMNRRVEIFYNGE